MEDLRRTIALLFKLKGRDTLSEREFVLSASMDQRWFPPKEAQRLLQVGLEMDLLQSHEGSIRPTFDVGSVEVPRGFAPSPSVLEVATPAAEDLFLGIVDAIAERTNSDRKTVIATVNAIQERMELEVEVAALVAARKANLDVTPFLGRVRERLRLP